MTCLKIKYRATPFNGTKRNVARRKINEKDFDLYKTAQVLLASTSLMLAMSAHAYTWELDDISTSTKYTVEPHFSILAKVPSGKTFNFQVIIPLKAIQLYL